MEKTLMNDGKYMNKEQVHALYTSLIEGLTRLFTQSEAAGGDVDLNPARLHLVALSGYLAENSILDALNGYAAVTEDPSLLEDCSSEVLPII
jgi:hypothetical protein